ncbi:MAG: ABC transporter permease [Geodermatophilaceae bacterium]|nr:ABC transporter permease [Geodermatophilaceae bacterium]
MLASFSAELLKLRKRPAAWVLGGVWLTMLVTFAYLLPYFAAPDGGGPGGGLVSDLLPAGIVGNTVGGYALFGGALVMILGALVAGSEYGWGSLKTVLTQRPGRLSVFGGTVAALAVILFAAVLISFAVSAGASAAIASAESLPIAWPSVADIVQGIAAGWLVLMMWCLFGLLLGTLTRGTALAIGLGLVWALVVENLIRASANALDWLDAVQRVLPGVNAGSLVAALGARGIEDGEGTPGVAAIVSGTQGTVVVAVLLVAFAAVAAVLVQRRDVV